MTTATKHLLTVTKAPTGRGTFEGIIEHNPPGGDKDGERIESFTNVPGVFQLGYSHVPGDPGALIGTAHVMPKGDDRHLLVFGRLDLTSPMGRAVHERMLLPSSDSMSLRELSVGFDYGPNQIEPDANGVGVIRDAVLREISVVYRGAQATAISGVKTGTTTVGSTATVTRTNTPATSKASQMIAAAKARVSDSGVLQSLDQLAGMDWPDQNLWLLEAHLHDVTGTAEIKTLNDRLAAIELGQRPRDADAMVDAFITAVRLEIVEEKLAEARASSFDAALNERAANKGPAPMFDERFAVVSVPTEYESGDTQPVLVVGVESETFRLAVLPGTMRPTMSDVERVEVEIYGTDMDGSHIGRLETNTGEVPIVTDRERVLQDALDTANNRIAELEQMLTEAHASDRCEPE